MLRFVPILLAVIYGYAFWRFSVWRTVKDLNARSSELMDPALRGVTDKLAKALDLPKVRVFLYENPVVNGLAGPDGRIYITRLPAKASLRRSHGSGNGFGHRP
jgi:putative metalloprotease